MAISLAIREKIIEFHKKGLSKHQIAKQLNEPRSTVIRTIQKFEATGKLENECKSKSGRPRSVRTKKLIAKVRAKIKRNPNRSARKIAKEYGTSNRIISTIIKYDLKMKCFKFQKRQLLSEATKKKRHERATKLVKYLAKLRRPSIIWSDEKIFTVQRIHNHQNYRLYAVNYEDIPQNERTMFFRQHPASVMVWGGVTDCGKKTPLIVIPAGVKVNTDIYIELLDKQVLKWIKKQQWPNGYCFMQDGAPSHTSNKTQAYLRENFDEFWSKEKWPPSSPDANPMDFSI